MTGVRIITPNGGSASLLYMLGGLILLLNKIRHGLRGYTQPRPFPIAHIEQAITYDIQVVKLWRQHLVDYLGPQATLKGKTILELGPGADLGVGILTLLYGAKKYHALDVHNLVEATPQEFYEQLFHYLANHSEGKNVDLDFLQQQLERALRGQKDKLNYVCDKDFDVSVFADEGIDLVVSQAAFEHFDDVSRLIAALSRIVKPGAVLIAEVDLQTHSRWLRDVDPLNIYRYTDRLYNTLRFRGAPNRLRPFEYKNIFRSNGWTNIQVEPMVVLEKTYALETQPYLAKRFQDQGSGMDQLVIVLRATKA